MGMVEIMRRPDLQSISYYDRVARIAPWLNQVTAFIDGVDAAVERRRLIDQLGLDSDHCVLEVAVGTGGNLPFLSEKLGPHGKVAGLDVSRAMIRRCRRRSGTIDCRVALVEGVAERLPFPTDTFDAVVHFGGINAFVDVTRAISEMVRVATPGATVVISDKSLPADRPRSPRQRALLWLKPRLALPPPIDAIPLPREEIELRWFWGGAAYILSFTVPE